MFCAKILLLNIQIEKLIIKKDLLDIIRYISTNLHQIISSYQAKNDDKLQHLV
jgi:hypothetical protein